MWKNRSNGIHILHLGKHHLHIPRHTHRRKLRATHTMTTKKEREAEAKELIELAKEIERKAFDEMVAIHYACPTCSQAQDKYEQIKSNYYRMWEDIKFLTSSKRELLSAALEDYNDPDINWSYDDYSEYCQMVSDYKQ